MAGWTERAAAGAPLLKTLRMLLEELTWYLHSTINPFVGDALETKTSHTLS